MPTRVLHPALIMLVTVCGFDVVVLQQVCPILMGQPKHVRSFPIEIYQLDRE